MNKSCGRIEGIATHEGAPMTVTVVKKGTAPDPTYISTCRHCNSTLEAKRKDLTFYPGAWGLPGALLARCPVCERQTDFKLK